MLTVLIGGIAFVALFAAVSNGEWTAVIVGVVILLLLMCASSEERKNVKAFRNFRDHWYNGGP